MYHDFGDSFRCRFCCFSCFFIFVSKELVAEKSCDYADELLGDESNVEMTIHYHRPTTTVFLDQPVEVTCRVSKGENQLIEWRIDGDGGEDFQIDNQTSQRNEQFITKFGECVTQTTYVLTFKAREEVVGISAISCFAGEQPLPLPCDQVNDTETFCDAIYPQFEVIDGPKAPPELEWDYPEKPGAIHPGGTVRFTCVVYHGPGGTLQWVVFSREEGQAEGIPTGEVVPPDSKSVTHFVSDEDLKGRETSILKLQVAPPIVGLSVACFAYNAVGFVEPLVCGERDRYCKQTPELVVSVLKAKAQVPDWLRTSSYLRELGIALLVVWFVLFFALFIRHWRSKDSKTRSALAVIIRASITPLLSSEAGEIESGTAGRHAHRRSFGRASIDSHLDPFARKLHPNSRHSVARPSFNFSSENLDYRLPTNVNPLNSERHLTQQKGKSVTFLN